ncbi:MAG: GyrI-like domain-containing protein [Tannerella sp.]|nr:GyrI-like domain-containing protein [Tannerella sp.]
MKVTLIIVAIIIVLIIALYTYYGGFRKINFKVEALGGETLVYENVVGDYQQASKVSNKIYYALLNDEKIATTKGFGIYYDNPKNVEKSKLRSEVGCIVENLDSATLARLSEKYQVKIFPQSQYVVTEFPFKGGMSIMVGIMKVYPALAKYIESEKLKDSPIMEIYDVPNKVIIYRKEIVPQNSGGF